MVDAGCPRDWTRAPPVGSGSRDPDRPPALFLVTVPGAPAAALGLIEGIADALSGVAKVVGGALADDPGRRRSIAVGGYTLTAILSALIGISTTV